MSTPSSSPFVKRPCLLVISALLLLSAFTALFLKWEVPEEPVQGGRDLQEILQSGEIRAVTLEGSATYFSYKGLERGLEFHRCVALADSLGLRLTMLTARTDSQMIEYLMSGKADVMVTPLPTRLFGDSILSVGPYSFTRLMLLERGQTQREAVQRPEQLEGQTVHVARQWEYEMLKQTDMVRDSLIRVICLNQDSISEEDLVQGLFESSITYMAATEQTAAYSLPHYPALRSEVPLSGYERLSWAVRKDAPEFSKTINHYLSGFMLEESAERISSSKRLYESAKGSGTSLIMSLRNRQVSTMDSTFRRVASETGTEWRLLAAIAYTESSFDSTLVSRKGAVGVMQVMPATLQRYTGKEAPEATNYDVIKAAALVLEDNRKAFIRVPREERLHFILAAYNSGIGHVKDAQALCEKYGRNPLQWAGAVEDFIRLKSQEAFYQDSICKFGYLNGTETCRFVEDVEKRLELLEARIPDEDSK